MNTQMELEARAAPELVSKQFDANKTILEALAQRIIAAKPNFAMTIARGSSDHAATFAKYLFETQLGLITASAAPSVITFYQSQLNFANALVFALSQSGQSHDLIEVMQAARDGGALTAVFVNEVNSPLAQVAEYVIPLRVGAEKAVAATKSFIATLTALLQLVSVGWDASHSFAGAAGRTLRQCLPELPDLLQQALQIDCTNIIAELKTASSVLVVGRGYGFPIAQEVALKFKETTGIHAEAFSAAELLHGPVALVSENSKILFLVQADATLPEMLTLAKQIKQIGATIIIVMAQDQITQHPTAKLASLVLPLPASLHPCCDPVVMIQALYPMLAKLSVARGYNPDSPIGLKKVTQTR